MTFGEIELEKRHTPASGDSKGIPQKRKALLLLEEAYPTKYWTAALSLLGRSDLDFTFSTLRGQDDLHNIAASAGMQASWLNCSSSRHYPGAVRTLAKSMRTQQFQILHLNESIQAALGGVASALARNGVRIYHRHHLRIEGSYRIYTKVAAKLSHVTMAVSQAVADQAIKEGADPGYVRVAHNGVAPPRFVDETESEALRRGLGIPGSDSIVMMIGLLREEKGHRTFLQALSRLLSEHPDSNLSAVIVGSEPHKVREPNDSDGAYAIEIKDLARKTLSKRVHFVPHQRDTAPWLALADMIVMPSTTETFGLVAAEAMAAERPVICSNVDGLKEIVVGGVTGITTVTGDPSDLAKAILELFSDKTKARRFGLAGAERQRLHFTIESMVEGWLRVYEEAIDMAAARTGRPRPR